MSVAALTARRLRGFEVTIGEDAYRDEDCLAELEAALR
jgi:hypothetical protein